MITLFLAEMDVLLNLVSSFMTALLPVEAAMCAHVMPSCRHIQYTADNSTQQLYYDIFAVKTAELLNTHSGISLSAKRLSVKRLSAKRPHPD